MHIEQGGGILSHSSYNFGPLPKAYGTAPFTVAVIHGGPGTAGEMAPVARRLAAGWGVVEPIQTTASPNGQVEELRLVLQEDGRPPVVLIGFSWGAWLNSIVAARRSSCLS